MRPHFDCDPTPWQGTKLLFHPFLGGRRRAFSQHLPCAVHHIIVAGLVSQVHADRNRLLAGFAPLRTLRTSVILLHGRFSFLHFECVSHWELIASRWGPAFSFHLSNTFPSRARKRAFDAIHHVVTSRSSWTAY